MAYWELFQDPANIDHYLEIRIADTWTEHMRQHERVTKNVQVMEDLNNNEEPAINASLLKRLKSLCDYCC